MEYFNEDKAVEDFFSIIPKEILKKVIDQFYLKDSYIHGTPHWSRVFYYGTILSELNDFDKENIAFFSIFHDSKRLNDFEDPEHGIRAAEFFNTLDKIIHVKPEQKEIIYEACKIHNYQKQADSNEVGLCLDADRLDLWRVGIIPNNDYLHMNQSKNNTLKNFSSTFTIANQLSTKLSSKMISEYYDLNVHKKDFINTLNKIRGFL